MAVSRRDDDGFTGEMVAYIAASSTHQTVLIPDSLQALCKHRLREPEGVADYVGHDAVAAIPEMEALHLPTEPTAPSS